MSSLLLKACLNGSRRDDEHPAIPRTPAQLAAEGRAAVDAGAGVLHLHPYDDEGAETLAAEPCAAALRAVHAACPGVPVSLSTSAEIEADPQRRYQGEPGILELCERLMGRGVGIEAGLLRTEDARAFVAAGIADRCARVLIEPLDADPATAVAHAAEIESVVGDAPITLEQVHHGDDLATWHVMERGVSRGHGIRVGLEDTTVLPDGRQAAGNGELVRVAAEMLRG